MRFVSVRVVSSDVARLVEFYEQATGLEARWPAEQFAELVGSSCTLAIGSAQTMALFSAGAAVPDSNRTAIFEFLVEDVDREYERLTNLAVVPEIVQKPTTMPWGNRSLLLRDPDGNLVNQCRKDPPVRFVSVRVVSSDVARLVEFYEQATGLEARWPAEQFAELVGSSCTLAIGSAQTMALFSAGAAVPDSNRTAIFEFLVEDVDREYERLTNLAVVPEIVQKPTTMPWGNRSLLLRDPDGNLVNFFAPLTEEARARLAR